MIFKTIKLDQTIKYEFMRLSSNHHNLNFKSKIYVYVNQNLINEPLCIMILSSLHFYYIYYFNHFYKFIIISSIFDKKDSCTTTTYFQIGYFAIFY